MCGTVQTCNRKLHKFMDVLFIMTLCYIYVCGKVRSTHGSNVGYYTHTQVYASISTHRTCNICNVGYTM